MLPLNRNTPSSLSLLQNVHAAPAAAQGGPNAREAYVERRGLIDSERTNLSEGERFTRPLPEGAAEPGDPNRILRECTTHFDVIDAEGNAVSVTQSLGAPFGCGYMAGQTGVVLNNGVMWFDPEPGSLVSVGPGKRLMTAGSPTLVLRDGQPLLAIGAPGEAAAGREANGPRLTITRRRSGAATVFRAVGVGATELRPASVRWDFGGGDTATGVTARRTFADDARLRVTVSALDMSGTPIRAGVTLRPGATPLRTLRVARAPRSSRGRAAHVVVRATARRPVALGVSLRRVEKEADAPAHAVSRNRVTERAGRRVAQTRAHAPRGRFSVSVPTRGLPAGVYRVEITTVRRGERARSVRTIAIR